MNTNTFALRYDMQMDAGQDQADILIYGEITDFKSASDDISALDFDRMLKDAKAKGAKTLNIRINSPGGHIYQAVAMRSMLINSQFDQIQVSIEGLCASAATLLCCLPNAHVTITEGSEVMIHNPSCFAWGTAADMRAAAERLDKTGGSVCEIYAAHTGMTPDRIQDMMNAETWMSAGEAVQAGFCDEILKAAPVVASATFEQMETMRYLYRHIPTLSVLRPQPPEQDTPTVRCAQAVSTASGASENTSTSTQTNAMEQEDLNMDIRDITMEQLRRENPELLNAAIAEERQRVQDIEDLTLPGYEQMAAEAKSNGTSAIDFQKMVVRAQREKGARFMQQRTKETEDEKKLRGGSADESSGDELAAYVREMNAYAAKAQSGSNTMY